MSAEYTITRTRCALTPQTQTLQALATGLDV
jgi:hypothetical protein